MNSSQSTSDRKKDSGKSVQQVVDDQLASDKDAGESIKKSTKLDEIQDTISRTPKYQSKFAQIDGKGGTVEAAIEDTVVDGCVIEPE